MVVWIHLRSHGDKFVAIWRSCTHVSERQEVGLGIVLLITTTGHNSGYHNTKRVSGWMMQVLR